MKPALKVMAVAGLSALFLAGCSSKTTEPSAHVAQPAPVQQCEHGPGVPAPMWVCNPFMEGGMAAIGEGRPNPANDRNLQRRQAVANARQSLAEEMSVKVQGMLTDWVRSTGAGSGQTYESNIENVTRQVADQTLQGSRQMNQWFAPDGTLVVLVGMPEQQQIGDNIRSSLRNDEALYQQFSSKQALEALDARINQEFGIRR
ncbi:LPP20 family lipoprotein [Marinospirillum alkaliphilum]|uniref:LPP20 lipoprotein n=1 Tax=Marinospirillum alkaliphilum DSM 21637 TaxID=1122209 RepID=A0A1K2A3X5_9GAMM|nr:LPP20 family lipoprotein [Marinospirillum alkaliphilum]SFX81057.1 LPP20 lipoprotein [Marinospirillum alkaliphilum DSM 21637]